MCSVTGPRVYLPHGKVESSWSRGQTHVPFTGRRIPNHWTTREIPQLLVLIAYLCERDLFSLMYIYLYWWAFPFIIFLFLVVAFSFLLREVPFVFVCLFPFLFIFCCAGSSLLCGLFSSCSKWGLLSSCIAWASHCGGFSCWGVWTVGHATVEPVVAACGLSSCGSWALEHRLSTCDTWA